MIDWDDFKLIIGIIVGFVIVFIVIGYGAYLVESASCDRIGNFMGFPSQYTLLSGCMIKYEGNLIPLESYYVRDDK